MKRKWKERLKKAGILLLLAAVLAQTANAYVYAGTEVNTAESQRQKEDTEAEKNAKSEKNTEDEKNAEDEEDTKTGNAVETEKDAKEEKGMESEKKSETEKNTEIIEGIQDKKDSESLKDIETSKNTEAGEDMELEENAESGKDTGMENNTESKEDTKESIEGTAKEAVQEAAEEIAASQRQKEQYHFQEGNVESIQQWMKLYLPEGYRDILLREKAWWEALYDYERDLAEFIQSSLVELDPYVYGGQDLAQILSILEQGVSAAAFFEGTIFQILELSDLQELQADGWTLDQVYEFLAAFLEEDMESELYRSWQAGMEDGEEGRFDSLLNAAEKILTDLGMVQTYSAASGVLEAGDKVASLSVSATGYSGTGHGTIYKLTLGGEPALCLSMGKSARNGYKYFAEDGSYDSKQGGIGYLISYASLSGKYYAVVQIAAWLYLQSSSLSQNQVISRAVSMLNTSSDEASNMAEMVWDYYQGACHHSNTYYAYHSANSSAQTAGVRSKASASIYQPGTGGGGEEPDIPEVPKVEPEFSSIEDSIAVSYGVQVKKTDWQTKVGLAGCVIDIFENGEKAASVTTDINGEASWSTSKSASYRASYCSNYDELTPEQQAEIDGHTSMRKAQAEIDAQKEAFAAVSYTYSIREVTAPAGYVWQANEASRAVSGNGTADFHLTNERTLGSVELVKYDTETESGIAQGDADLKGAVYGIYAAENIIHGDRKTGILFRKDALVARATVGRSPKQDKDGYILNTDGSRHIANPSGTIAYVETPGKTAFGDLELGSYYIRELTPPEGYMLDEARYPAAFTYKNQMTRVEVRNEQAKDADNQLTADNQSSSHTIYSGDYVMKQGIQILKTSDNGYQTELSNMAGAGFSVYRIRELSKVKDGTLAAVNGIWGSDDISSFWEYDFTNEPKAVVYKRSGQEQWTAGDRKWLVSAGGVNRYQVAEMFTDKEGHIETPELPYGTYVIAETTTPEGHVMAKPFIVHISQDGGVLYTDTRKQTVEKTYTSAEGIRYGDHKNTKDREGRILQKPRMINNRITTAYLRIVKADEEFLVQPGAYIKADEMVRGTVLKEGAEYRLRCLTKEASLDSLKALNWKMDSEGYLSFYNLSEKVLTGTEEYPFTTSFLKEAGKVTDCYITLPRELPVGTYELTELTAPEGYVVNGREQAVKDTSTEGQNGYELVGTSRERTIFAIENGSVYPDGQMGVSKYAICDAYGNLTVTVLQKNQEQKGIIEIYKHGEQLAGTGEDTKTLLDKLVSEPFRYLKLEDIAMHKDVTFSYEDAPVEGAGFQIVAAEDIYSQEIDLKLLKEYGIDPEPYRIWKKGDVAAEVTTDRNGYAYASGLYIGKYKIRETVAGSGFVLNTAEEEFAITPQRQTVSFDIKHADYKNERQRLKIKVVKKDRDSGKCLQGAICGLYAGEDIYTGIVYSEEKNAWILREEPVLLFPEGTLIAACITDLDGNGVFDEDLPLGRYEVRELEAPVGYLQSEEVLSVDGSYESEKGGQKTDIQEHVVVLENQITRVRFRKLDLTDGQELAGALLEVWELPFAEKDFFAASEGEREQKPDLEPGTEVIKDSWISTGPARMLHMTEGLQLGRVYAFREAEPAPGYVTAEDVHFRLEQARDTEGKLLDAIEIYLVDSQEEEQQNDTDISITADEEGSGSKPEGQEVQIPEKEDSETEETDKRTEDENAEPVKIEVVEMEDDVTKVQISKKDITTREELPGALLELYDENQVLVETWVSTNTPHYIERLPIGTYRLVEKEAPSGYGYAEDVIFQILDTDEVQTVEMLDDFPKEDEPETPKETPGRPVEESNHSGGGSGNHEPEALPWEVGAPKLGDGSRLETYLFVFLLLLAVITAGIFRYRANEDE